MIIFLLLIEGIITLDDLANYTSTFKYPLSVKLDNGNHTVFGPVPPSSGVVIHYILNILDGKLFILFVSNK